MQALPVLQPLCCGSDTTPLAHEAAAELADRFHALADPTRVAIVNRLSGADELCVCDLAWIAERAENLVSHHVRVLRNAGLVTSRRDGKMVLYALTEPGRELLESVLRDTTSQA